MSNCKHIWLSFESINTSQFKYRQPTEEHQRDALTIEDNANKKRNTIHGQSSQLKEHGNSSSGIMLPSETKFPAPLVIPGHDLALNPDYPPQPVQEWLGADYRNKVTAERNTVYVAAPPKVPKGLSYVNKWTIPSRAPAKKTSNGPIDHGPLPVTPAPAIDDAAQYLQAFYHGMRVKLLQDPALEWVEWEPSAKSRTKKAVPWHQSRSASAFQMVKNLFVLTHGHRRTGHSLVN